MNKTGWFILWLLVCALIFSGCMTSSGQNTVNDSYWMPTDVEMPEIPDDLEPGTGGIPTLNVYNVQEDKIEKMDLEEYLAGVVAGEMKNDWPMEALKAQAILARTFVLRFCDTKDSQYEGADISTDVSEAQAYAPENINDRVRQAVEETRGIVMSHDGDYPNAWFFAHAGGRTELASVGLEYRDGDPEYLAVVDSPDSEKAPGDVKKWTAKFTLGQLQQACKDAGTDVGEIETIEIGERGASGRVKHFLINGKEVSAPTLRLKLGANKLKSTLIENIETTGDSVAFTGRGFGHGVGMSQWGAYALAEEGKNAIEIINHYFKNIDIVDLW